MKEVPWRRICQKSLGKGRTSDVVTTVPFGVNTGQRDIKLGLNMYPSTKTAVLNDLVEVLNRQGIYELLILNSHGMILRPCLVSWALNIQKCGLLPAVGLKY